MLDIIDIFSKEDARFQRYMKYQKYPLKLFYKLFVSKDVRRKHKFDMNLQQKKHVASLWEYFLEKYFNGELKTYNLKKKKDISHPSIIWQYWGQGIDHQELPNIVKICFASVDRYKGDYQVIRLDEKTVLEYLDLPDFVWSKKKNPLFKHAFFSDLIRLALLDVYGGIWLDATILLTSEIEEEILKQDFFMFQRSTEVLHKEKWIKYNSDYFGWDDKHFVNVLNSFIVSKSKNRITHTCLDIMLNYWETQNNIPHYFFFQIMFDVLIKKYLKDEKILLRDDTLPHLLQEKLNKRYIYQEYIQLVNKINIHKTTYIQSKNVHTYYSKLMKEFL